MVAPTHRCLWFVWVLVAAGCGGGAGSVGGDAGLDAGQTRDARPGGEDGGPDASPEDATPCHGQSGTFHDQPLDLGSETRHFFLHVPAAYDCGEAWPLLVDFHGTAVGTEADLPEEYYGLEGLIAAADDEGFLVVRPRSRFAVLQDEQVYQWDVSFGDLERNRAFAHALVAWMQSEYHVDESRVYAAGFSNGTNMAAQLLGDAPRVFSGFAFVAGGLWAPPSDASLAAAAPRVYATTGYRDYMLGTQRDLLAFLAEHGLPTDRLWVRETDTGHDLYGWHYREALAWLARGEQPGPGTLAAGWTLDPAFTDRDSLLQLAQAPGGEILAAAAGGTLWRREVTGEWVRAATVTDGFAPALTDLCVLPAGAGVAVGEGILARTDDGGATWTVADPVPPFSSTWFPYSYLTSVGCGGGLVVGGGYQTAVVSADAGVTWAEAAMPSFGYAAQVVAVRPSASGTWLATGYWDYVGRSTDGETFVEVATPMSREWWTDAAAAAGGRWIAVGEAGAVIVSTDDGQSFAPAPGVTAEDLYAVAFGDEVHAMAVGAHGTALLTSDGGDTWQDVSTGLDGFLGDVVWLSPVTALVVGEDGVVVTYDVP